MGVKFSNQQNAALLYPNLSTRVNNNNTSPNNSLDEVKKPTKIVLLGTGEGGKSTIVKSLNYWYPIKRKYNGGTSSTTTTTNSSHQQVVSNSISGSSLSTTPHLVYNNSYSNTSSNNFLQQGSISSSLNSSLSNIHQNSPISSSVNSNYLSVNSVNSNGEFLSTRNTSTIPKSPRTHSFDLSTPTDLQCIIFDESLRDSIDLREDFSNSYRNPEYRRLFIYPIHRNTLLAMYGLVDGCTNIYHAINFQLLDPMHDYYLIDSINAVLDAVSNMNKDNYWVMTKSVAEKIKYLWYEVPQIQEIYEMGNEMCFDYMESARYWFTSIDRIADPYYVPTINDILRIRMRTTGLVESLFHVPIKIRKTTTYYYYNCENEKVRLGVERSDQSPNDLNAVNSFDCSMSIDGSFLDQQTSKPKKDYVVSYTIQDRFQDTKFTMELDDILPQNTSLLEPIFENKIMKDSQSSKTLVMYKPIRVVNMGSQRSERKKWINGFDEVSAVLFVVALSEYNQVLYEDRKTNRMMESLLVFNEIINSTFFADVPVFLIFNKYDVFLEKIQKHDLSIAFGKEVPDDLKLNAKNPFYQFATNYIQERLNSHQKKLEEDSDDIAFDQFMEGVEKKRKMNEKSLSYEFKNGTDSEDFSEFVLSQNEEKNIFDDLISKEEKRSLKKALAQTKKKTSIFGFLTPRAKREEEQLAQQYPLGQRFNNQLSQKRKKKKEEPVRAPSVLDKAIETESKASCSSLSTMSRHFNPNRLSDDNLLRQIMSQNYSNCNVRGLQQLTSTNVGAEEEDDTENDVLDDDAEWTYCEEDTSRVMIELPPEALIYVCMFLDAKDLCSLSEVNYDFYRIATSDIVWRSLCLRYQEDVDENIIISKYALYMQEDADNKIFISVPSISMKTISTRSSIDDSQNSDHSIKSNRRIFAKGVYKYWYEFGQSFIKRNIDFIVSKFMEQTTRKDIKIHITTAIDIDSLKPIMDSTFNRIIKHVAEQKD